LNMAHV